MRRPQRTRETQPWAQGGQPRVVFNFTIADGKIVAIDLLADPELLGQLAWEALGASE